MTWYQVMPRHESLQKIHFLMDAFTVNSIVAVTVFLWTRYYWGILFPAVQQKRSLTLDAVMELLHSSWLTDGTSAKLPA